MERHQSDFDFSSVGDEELDNLDEDDGDVKQ